MDTLVSQIIAEIAYAAGAVASTKPATKPTPVSGGRWVSLFVAADHLGESMDGLRKRLERASQLVDGHIEAELDGIRARKLGRLWKISLPEDWR